MEFKLKEEDEKKKRLMDKKRLQKLKQKDLPRAIAESAQSTGAELLHYDTNFTMPIPQISDQELYNISKYSNKEKNVGLQDNDATYLLIGEYSRKDLLTPSRQTPMVSERILKNA